MIITLEDYLVQLHQGQWFGFNGEHIYDNLVIHSDEFAKPTEKECVDGVARLQTTWDSQEYSRNRKEEYPDIGDQLDALYHAGAFPEDMATKIKAVKEKYPKE